LLGIDTDANLLEAGGEGVVRGGRLIADVHASDSTGRRAELLERTLTCP
jgi:hypothetical protein